MRPVTCAGSGCPHSAKTASPGCLPPSLSNRLAFEGRGPKALGPVRGALASSDLPASTHARCARRPLAPAASPRLLQPRRLFPAWRLFRAWGGRSSLPEWGSASALNILGCSLNRDHSSLSNSAQGVPVLSRTAEPSRKNPSGLRSAKSTSFSRHRSVSLSF